MNETVESGNEEEDFVTKCPECNSSQLARDYEHGELVCENCGIVIDENFVDQKPEWRAFDSEQADSRTRVGAPMTYRAHDKGLSTDIGIYNKDSYGRPLSTKNRSQFYRMRQWQKRIRVSNQMERNLSQALQELERIASNMSLPKDVRETSAVIYRKALKQNIIRGRSIEGVVAGSIYAACRVTNVPRTLDEIVSVTRVKRKEIGRTYRILSRYLKMNLMPSRPEDYVNRFCSRLKLSMEARKKAVEILDSAEKAGTITGKSPTGEAAAAIYVASLLMGEKRTQAEVSRISGVTEVTIRNRYKDFSESMEVYRPKSDIAPVQEAGK